jgi:hypothetical protein
MRAWLISAGLLFTLHFTRRQDRDIFPPGLVFFIPLTHHQKLITAAGLEIMRDVQRLIAMTLGMVTHAQDNHLPVIKPEFKTYCSPGYMLLAAPLDAKRLPRRLGISRR